MPILIKGSGGGSQEAPVISVSSDGLITATAGGKSSTKQLATQGAKTVTPNSYEQTAISSGVYATGNVTVLPVQPKTVSTSATCRPEQGGTYSITFNCDGLTPASEVLGAYSVFGEAGSGNNGIIVFEPENNDFSMWYPVSNSTIVRDRVSVSKGYGSIQFVSANLNEANGESCSLVISFI